MELPGSPGILLAFQPRSRQHNIGRATAHTGGAKERIAGVFFLLED
jgi:hypothetical protein